MKFDDILEEIGEFGPYQKRIFYLLSLPVIFSGLQLMSVVFTYSIPSYRCVIPSYPNDTFAVQNSVHAHLINLTIPSDIDTDDNVYSHCEIYSNITDRSLSNTNYNSSDDISVEVQDCNKWVFDQTYFDETIITEFQLVCGDEIMRSHANMLMFFGGMCGSAIMGIVADLFGRKVAIMSAVGLSIIASLVTILSTSFYAIMAIRFVGGIGTHTLFSIPCTTAIELVGRNKRSFAGTVAEMFWSVGMLLLFPAAYFLRNWRHLQIAISLFLLLLLPLWWLIPESPRWLLEKGRYKEVEVILQRICKSNKCQLPEGAVNEDTKEETPQVSLKELFTNRKLLIRTLIIFYNWFAVNTFYYGVSLNVTNLEGSPYLNYLYMTVIELIAYVFTLAVVDRIGRRHFHFWAITVGSLACLAVIPLILVGEDGWPVNVLALIGKFCSSVCYTIVYIMSAELFPTVLRNSGIGFCAVFESLGGLCSPYIADLGILVEGPMGKGLSMVVFGVISLMAGGLTLFLPETRHRKLPETIQDAIDFDKQQTRRPRKKGQNIYRLTPVTDDDRS